MSHKNWGGWGLGCTTRIFLSRLFVCKYKIRFGPLRTHFLEKWLLAQGGICQYNYTLFWLLCQISKQKQYSRSGTAFSSCNANRGHLYINLACLSGCLSVCLFVCLYPINVKTAEPIGPKFFVGHLGTPGKVYEKSKFQIFVSIKIRSSLNF